MLLQTLTCAVNTSLYLQSVSKTFCIRANINKVCTIFIHLFKGANNHAMIRVLSLGFAERSLLKGFTGAVTDLAFAHLDSSLLGCVDEAGNLMVWQITCSGNKILYP